MKGRYSVSDNEIVRRYVCEQGEDTAGATRTGEYSRSKILLVKEIIGRVIKSGVGFGYALADSWFACAVILVGSPLCNEKTEMLYKRIIANECQNISKWTHHIAQSSPSSRGERMMVCAEQLHRACCCVNIVKWGG